MVKSSATPMIIDHPIDDIRKGEKNAAKRKVSEALPALPEDKAKELKR